MIVLVGVMGSGRERGCMPSRAAVGVDGGWHNFKIGQNLFLAGFVVLNWPEGVYVIVKRLPERDGEFEYQIKNLAEPDERVVRESQLRPSPWHRSGGRPDID